MIAERRAFGERLRRQRQRHNLSLTQVAAVTKVGSSHYAALERGDCSRWPGGVYNRAFIRAYAQAVGLNPDDTAAEFAEIYDPAPAAPAQQPQAETSADDAPSRPPLRIAIEPDPYEAEKRIVRVAALVILDLVAIIALAATGMLFTAASFWISLAAASLGYVVLSRVIRSVPRPGGHRAARPAPARMETADTAQSLP